MSARKLLPFAVLLSACGTLCQDPAAYRPSGDATSRAAPPPAPRAPQIADWHPMEYTARHVATPPVIDGKLDDEVWQSVPWTPDFFHSMNFSAPKHRTRAKLVWDDANLYVAFDVEDDDIVSRDPQTGLPYDHDDDSLYNSEVVEIFLDADNDGATYNEIEVSPLDKLFDASFTARRQGMNLGWSSGVRHAVQVRGTVNKTDDVDQGWTAELAIPFANLMAVPHLPPQPGERWRFDMFRLDHGRGVGEDGQAFAPVMAPDFHNLPKYGTLILAGPG